MLEIRFHGRGGQGAKTAAIMIAEAFIRQGMHAQAFPEFGPERRGAPVRSFARASKEPILLHESISNPDIVVVLDDSLAESSEITEGLKKEGILIVNSSKENDFFKTHTGFSGKIISIDASKIANETIGNPIANTVMLGALASFTDVDFKSLKDVVLEYFTEKKGKDVAEKNAKAMEIAFNLKK